MVRHGPTALFAEPGGAGKQRGGVSVGSHTEKNLIETSRGRALCGIEELTQQSLIILSSAMGIVLAANPMNVVFRDRDAIEQSFSRHPVIGRRVIRRDSPFVAPEHVGARPIDLLSERRSRELS